MKKLLALLLAACMLISVTAVLAEETSDMPLVVATSTLSEKFSPFFADTAYDQDVVSRTQVGMMTTDRVGGIVYNGIEGETRSYNGTDYTYYGTGDLTVNYDETTDITTYGYKMREDLKFSDGEPVTIYDIMGRPMVNHALPAGVYFVKVGQHSEQKIVVTINIP